VAVIILCRLFLSNLEVQDVGGELPEHAASFSRPSSAVGPPPGAPSLSSQTPQPGATSTLTARKGNGTVSVQSTMKG
jgi:hypothetical protein